MSTSSVTISFWLPVQAALLVLFYGNILPTLPLWLVWLPTILLGICLLILLITIVILFIMK